MIATASPGFEVRLVNTFHRPYDNAIATARTCYSSKGIIGAPDVAGDAAEDEEGRRAVKERRDTIADSIFQAGHHTPFQHVSFQFALSGVSRHFIWSFLHSHPFYNSEQVSQRYVKVAKDAIHVPDMPESARDLFMATVEDQMKTYRLLRRDGQPIVAEDYHQRFSNRQGTKRAQSDIRKRSQEAARYVLPIATTAYLYHTVSGITLLRYQRLLEQFDTLSEQRAVVDAMVAEVLRHDPDFARLTRDPIPLEETPEFEMLGDLVMGRAPDAELLDEFDETLAGCCSRLVDYKPKNEELVAQAVREVLGFGRSRLCDDDAIRLVLDPSQNRLLGDSVNLTTHSKVTRALFHASYTFRKVLSHTADSQDQRHRMTPGSRPVVLSNFPEAPDFVRPALIERDPDLSTRFDACMDRTWDSIDRLRGQGVSAEVAAYLLPNALAIRFTESCDLMGLRHKCAMRLCYNAQEEIWKASHEEALQICEVNPRIGRFLLPPCGLRHLSKSRPVCPEGDRYCGVPVWQLPREQWQRTL